MQVLKQLKDFYKEQMKRDFIMKPMDTNKKVYLQYNKADRTTSLSSHIGGFYSHNKVEFIDPEHAMELMDEHCDDQELVEIVAQLNKDFDVKNPDAGTFTDEFRDAQRDRVTDDYPWIGNLGKDAEEIVEAIESMADIDEFIFPDEALAELDKWLKSLGNEGLILEIEGQSNGLTREGSHQHLRVSKLWKSPKYDGEELMIPVFMKGIQLRKIFYGDLIENFSKKFKNLVDTYNIDGHDFVEVESTRTNQSATDQGQIELVKDKSSKEYSYSTLANEDQSYKANLNDGQIMILSEAEADDIDLGIFIKVFYGHLIPYLTGYWMEYKALNYEGKTPSEFMIELDRIVEEFTKDFKDMQEIAEWVSDSMKLNPITMDEYVEIATEEDNSWLNELFYWRKITRASNGQDWEL